MLVVLDLVDMVFFPVRMVFMRVLFRLHPFHDLFLDHIHVVHHRHDPVRARPLLKGICDLEHPLFHHAAVADQQIRVLNPDHIGRRRFEGMAVHPGRDDQRKPDPIPRNLPQKIIVGKQGNRHIQPPIVRFPLTRRAARSRKTERRSRQKRRGRPQIPGNRRGCPQTPGYRPGSTQEAEKRCSCPQKPDFRTGSAPAHVPLSAVRKIASTSEG